VPFERLSRNVRRPLVLLIIRDMMLRGSQSYKQFLECFESIATNILADRLRKLVEYGIITTQPDSWMDAK